MKATAEIQVIPIGVGVSLRKEVAQAHQLIVESGLNYELHGFGTNVEGELADILAVVQHIHEVLHAQGAPRLSTSLKLGTRLDKEGSLAGKVRAVQDSR
jgi:uncharacterized protein (TIGR00106 family)